MTYAINTNFATQEKGNTKYLVHILLQTLKEIKSQSPSNEIFL